MPLTHTERLALIRRPFFITNLGPSYLWGGCAVADNFFGTGEWAERPRPQDERSRSLPVSWVIRTIVTPPKPTTTAVIATAVIVQAIQDYDRSGACNCGCKRSYQECAKAFLTSEDLDTWLALIP